MVGLFWTLATERLPLVDTSVKPSLNPVSGGLLVVWWALFGFISVWAGRGKVFGVFGDLMADSWAILSRSEASDGSSSGVDKTCSMVDWPPDGGVSSRSRRDPSCVCVKRVFCIPDRCDGQHGLVVDDYAR